MPRSFFYEGETFPLTPRTAFHDRIYIIALPEAPDLAERLLEFDGFVRASLDT